MAAIFSERMNTRAALISDVSCSRKMQVHTLTDLRGCSFVDDTLTHLSVTSILLTREYKLSVSKVGCSSVADEFV